MEERACGGPLYCGGGYLRVRTAATCRIAQPNRLLAGVLHVLLTCMRGGGISAGTTAQGLAPKTRQQQSCYDIALYGGVTFLYGRIHDG